ncbi:type IV pilus modification protein PilV [Thiocapsa sp.]|uniref:type IV pilus modification protein PilV n=1 Tax=Thiocapsa sp. TaxID=2024551 RepID=UPI0025EBBE3C|nr:type IV pilus modification protein PilV [Thiocapsa sp.]
MNRKIIPALSICRSPIMRRHVAFRTARGVGLIEVLITMVVLSVGLLGLAALQASALKLAHQADIRSQATFLAYEMADRMRANREAALGDEYALTTFSAVECDPTLVLSDANTLAERDLDEWRNTLACLLPQGEGRIVRADEIVTIGVSCNDSRGAEAPIVFTMTTEL